jgi:restriction system protein
LNIAEAAELLRRLNPDLSPADLAHAAQASAGVPRAVKMLANLIRRYPEERIAHLLRGEIYDLERHGVKPPPKLITEIRPKIVDANEALLEKLKAQPDAIFQLPSRKFEELVAELLDDMGFEVELTKATRDGGKDILAYMNTGIGKFLCLVEAKKYRQDRTVGVELVRTLYGTLCDYQANSAMLVTTSSFSLGARAFQKKHEYQLSLQDYGNVVQWIQDYKKE